MADAARLAWGGACPARPKSEAEDAAGGRETRAVSGRKYSRFELTQERLHKLDAVRGCTRLASQCHGLAGRLRALLEAASPAALAQYAPEVARAHGWLSSGRTTPDATLSPACSRRELELALRERGEAVEEGCALVRELTEALEQRWTGLGQDLAARLAELEVAWLSAADLVELWFSREARTIAERMARARERLTCERFAEVAIDLDGLEVDIADALARAESLEERHQRRLMVMRAIREVCADLGFAELTPPRQSDPRERSSPLEIRLDTLDRGEIDFRVTLDAIRVNAGLAEEECIEEFALLAERLEEGHGVRTEFRREEDDQPILRQHDEKSLPDEEPRGLADER